MSSTLQKIDDVLDEARTLCKETFANGSWKSLIMTVENGGAVFKVRIWKTASAQPVEICNSPYREVAAQIYDAYDGNLREWSEAWLPRGFNGAESERAITHRVFAAGVDPEACILGFSDSIGHANGISSLDVEVESGRWEARFTSDGTSFKAGGHLVPGGAIMTSWK